MRNIIYVGVNDHVTDLFEGQYVIPNGVAYNSYIIIDEKTVIVDSVDARFGEEWLSNIDKALGGGEPDYLLVQHMEPDHSGSIMMFLEKYPNASVISSAKAFTMMENFYSAVAPERQIVVADGKTFSIGSGELVFVGAPMVHWPEVIMTWYEKEKILFTADAFGKFGALDVCEEWIDEARRYYIGIVGKYGAQVQSVLKKVAALPVETICPLHGPVLENDLGYYLEKYDKWSSYSPEADGVCIAYSSVYGNTAQAAKILYDELISRDVSTQIFDLNRCDSYEALASAFKYSKLVLASVTYNAELYPSMRKFISLLVERGYKNRKLALIENGSWAPMAAKNMTKMLEGLKGIEYVGEPVKLLSGVKESTVEQLKNLALLLAE